jgi:hypothetical protein
MAAKKRFALTDMQINALVKAGELTEIQGVNDAFDPSV